MIKRQALPCALVNLILKCGAPRSTVASESGTAQSLKGVIKEDEASHGALRNARDTRAAAAQTFELNSWARIIV